MIPGKSYSPEEILSILWRRKWLMVLAVIVGMGTGVLLCRVLPERYESEAKILALPQPVQDVFKAILPNRVDDRLNRLALELRGRDRLEALILEFDLYHDMRARGVHIDRVVDKMRKDIDLKLMQGDTLQVGYLASDPATAQKVTNRLVNLSIEATQGEPVEISARTTDFLDSRLADARTRLQEQEKKLEVYKYTYGPELPDQRPGNQQILQNAQLQLQSLQDSLSREREHRIALDRELATLSVSPAPSSVPSSQGGSATSPASTIAEQLQAERATLEDLKLRYTDNHPDVDRAKRRVHDLEKLMEAAPARPPVVDATQPARTRADLDRQNRIQQLKSDLEASDRQIAAKLAEERTLRGTMSEVRAHLDATPRRETELTALNRDYTTLSQLYTGLLTQKEASKQAGAAAQKSMNPQFKIVDPPRLPDAPVSPNPLLLTAAGAMAGLVLALGLIGFVEYRDTAFHTEDEVLASIGVPVIAMIPMMASANSADQGPRLKRWLGPLAGAAAPQDALTRR